MRIGSIVECIDNKGRCTNVERPRMNYPYTVNWIGTGHCEGFIGFEECDQDACYDSSKFREIQFPDDLQEQITEALTRELIIQP